MIATRRAIGVVGSSPSSIGKSSSLVRPSASGRQLSVIICGRCTIFWGRCDEAAAETILLCLAQGFCPDSTCSNGSLPHRPTDRREIITLEPSFLSGKRKARAGRNAERKHGKGEAASRSNVWYPLSHPTCEADIADPNLWVSPWLLLSVSL